LRLDVGMRVSGRSQEIASMTKTSSRVHHTSRTSRAVLVARPPADEPELDVHASLSELEQLLAGLGTVVAGTVIQRSGPDRPTAVLGTGKLEELRVLLQSVATEAPASPVIVVFDGTLTPGNERSLAAAAGVPVIDRAAVILRVFEQRAQTDVARLEVELARLAYEAPRVREDRSLVDREGGGGGRGERGHTNVELRKQHLRARATKLQAELERLRGVHTMRRERRGDLPRVGLVGYTNAGKSSLMRALTGSDVLIEDRLFATLGTTVRALVPDTTPRILVSDTVGFLRNLPHELLASFHTTLEEARSADLLLHVVDAADSKWRSHLEVTEKTLQDIGAGDVPMRVVLNKIDRVPPELRATLQRELPGAIQTSAHDPADVRRLHEAIVAFFEQDALEETLVVPIEDGALIAEILGSARVLEARYDDTHARLHVRARAMELARWVAGSGTS
jgi:GTP-binding protein HflX